MGLEISRARGETARSDALAARLARLGVPCVGCANCRGLCAALIEAIVLPEVILARGRGAQRGAEP